MIAHLTVDESGKRGDEPRFDKSKVKVYGLGLNGGSGGGDGQTQWSMYTGSNNWNYTDKPVGHPLQLRPARFPADHRLVPLTHREGLHAIR